MTMTEHTTVVGVFTERAQAERAIEDLYNAGFNENQIGFLGRGEDTTAPATPHVMPVNMTGGSAGMTGSSGMVMPMIGEEDAGSADEPEREPASVVGAATGAVGGGVIGGLVGAAAALLIPGIGVAIAGGILAATLGGVAIGAVAGGFIGALTGMGVPESDARYYHDELAAGRSIVTIHNSDRSNEALGILRSNGAYDASTRQDDTDEDYNTPPTGQYMHAIDPTVAASPNGLNPDTFTVAPAPQVDPASGTIVEPQPYKPHEHPDRADRPEYNPNIPGGTNQ